MNMNGQYGVMPQPFANPYLPVNPYASTFSQPTATKPIETGINWVQGIEGAKAWNLPPNSNVVLIDSEGTGNTIRFYIKTSDNIGMCNLRIFDGVEVTGQTNNNPISQIDMSAYVTRDELNQILSNLGGNNNAQQSVPTVKSKSNSGTTDSK